MDATFQNGIALNPKSILEKVDASPTTNSENLVSSGGVKTYVDQKDSATNSRVDALNTQISASFFFKGSSTFSNLPASGNTVNDTYYVTDSDKQCWYSWNGTDWIKSSMSQADYAGLIAQLKADISAEYSTSKTYKVGDYCLYGADGVLYICKTAVTTAGAFDSNKWQAISFGEAVGDLVIADDTQPTSLANKIWLDTDPNPDTVEVITEEDLGNIVAAEFDSASAYAVGDYCIHDANLYVAKTATAANDGWISSRWKQVTVTSTLNDQVGDLKEQFENSIYGIDTDLEYTAGARNFYKILLVKDQKYTVTNNSGYALSMDYVKPDASTVVITGNLADGSSYTFIPATNEYVALRIYLNPSATGTIHISADIALYEKTDGLELAKLDKKQADTVLHIVENNQTVVTPTWESGSFTNGLPVVNNNAMRTADYIQQMGYISVKNDASGLPFYVSEYDWDHTFLEMNSYSGANKTAHPENANCAFIRVHTYSTTVPQNEQASHITIEYVNEKNISDLEEYLEKYPEMFEWMTNGTVKYHADEVQINDHTNNDSGNTTYIYKRILDYVPCASSVIVSCDSITNARNNSIHVYFHNSGKTLLQEYAVATGIHQFVPPENATTVSINLYPSVTGGMSETTAVYGNVYVWFADTQKIVMSKTIDTTGLSVPYYYLRGDYLDNKISTIEGLMAAANGNYDAFIFCTDQHWRLNARNSPKLIRYICDRLPIRRLFMGGDYYDGINVNALYSFRNAFDGNVYSVTGNHEYMNQFASMEEAATSKNIGDGDIWAYLNMGMTDEVIGDAGRNYYYVDNPAQKMRYIILNVYADNGSSATDQFETDQRTWLSDVALNLPTGYTAVIFAHYLYSVNYNTGAISVSTNGSVITGIADAYSGGGEIACLVAGHTHVDGMTATSGGIPVFITTCDKYGAWINGGTDMEPWLTANRIAGTITEQAFDVVVVDKTNRLISFVRIGAPADNGTSEKLEIRQQSY